MLNRDTADKPDELFKYKAASNSSHETRSRKTGDTLQPSRVLIFKCKSPQKQMQRFFIVGGGKGGGKDV
jgi:hypothetical protein